MSNTFRFCICDRMITRVIALLLLALTSGPLVSHAQWKQTNGPYGGSIFAITQFGPRIICATHRGIFQTSDSVLNWTRTSAGLPADASIFSLTQRGSNIFAGIRNKGVYRSNDSGLTWTRVSNGLAASSTPYSLASSGKAIFALDSSGQLFLSVDDGAHWTYADSNLAALCKPKAMLAVGSAIYAVGAWITRTTDAGRSWEVVAVPPPDSAWSIGSIASIGDELFVYESQRGMMRSSDRGMSWTAANTGLPVSSGSTPLLANAGSRLYASTPFGIYTTSDSGSTWNRTGLGLPRSTTLSLFAVRDSILWVGFDGAGIYRSIDRGRTWSSANKGLVCTTVNAIASTSDNIFVGTDLGVFRSNDRGEVWHPTTDSLGRPYILSILADGAELFVSETAPDAILHSSDQGSHWQMGEDPGGRINSLLRSGTNVLAGGSPYDDFGFFYSSGFGSTWNDAEVLSAATEVNTFQLLKRPAAVLAATSAGVYKSTDNGLSWFVSSNGFRQSDQVAVLALGTDGANVFASCTSDSQVYIGVYKSSDEGESWIRTLDTLIPPLKCFANSGKSLFAGTDSSGIYITTDAGEHWTNINSGLGDSNIVSLAVVGDELIAGTATSGVWRRRLSELPLSRVTQAAGVTSNFAIYPNPCTASATISVSATHPSYTRISIVDPYGREITSLFSGILEAGEHKLQWDARGAASGIYECRIVRDDKTEHVSVIVLR